MTDMIKKDVEWNKVQLERALRSSVNEILESDHPSAGRPAIDAEERLKVEEAEYVKKGYTESEAYLQ